MTGKWRVRQRNSAYLFLTQLLTTQIQRLSVSLSPSLGESGFTSDTFARPEFSFAMGVALVWPLVFVGF
jgi:hypothetical protein